MERRLAELEKEVAKEKQRREAAEAHAERSQPTTLIEYLEACHDLSLAVKLITDKTLTTGGDTTNPTGRVCPQRIVPWYAFPSQQEEVWNKIAINTYFDSKRVFPSSHQLDYVRKYLDPISSEIDLRHYARETVENPVRTIIQEIYSNEQIREELRLNGEVVFGSHTNLGQAANTSINEEIEQTTMTEPNPSKEGGSVKGKSHKRDKADRKRIGNADQFCIYELSTGWRVPVVAIEYKAPHKFPLPDIMAGLKGEIQPAEEVINREGNDFEFLSKSLVAAVITQLFSYMVGKGAPWGYIFVGEAIIFLHIPDDPTIVYYHLSIPRMDFRKDDANRLHRTSVAQVSAFVLNALAAEVPSQSWHDAAANLGTWAVEYIDILRKIPETVRKASPHSTYKSSRWKGFLRSPTQTRSRHPAAACRPPGSGKADSHSDEDDDNDVPPPPSSHRTNRQRGGQGKPTNEQRGETNRPNQSNARNRDRMEATSRPRLEDRLYCTQRCLLGLAYGGPMDDQCPNIRDHPSTHIDQSTFLCLIRTQLTRDRGSDADCKPLYIKGSRGALFKVRLSSHGYTLVAKGMEQHNRKLLLYESTIYSQIRGIQGSFIPVCLGTVDLELPYYYDFGIYVSMLFLSWAGRPLCQYLNEENKENILGKVTAALQALHDRGVLHKDVEPRNMLWDEQHGNLMLVDFERAEVRTRRPLSPITLNPKENQKRKMDSVLNDSDYDGEMRSATGWVLRCMR